MFSHSKSARFALAVLLILPGCPLLFAAAPQSAEETKLVDAQFGRAFLGIGYQDKEFASDKGTHNAYLVTLVIRNSAAEQAGLVAGDLILVFDDKKVSDIDQGNRTKYFSDYVKNKKVGSKLSLKVLRVKMLIDNLDNPEKTFASKNDLLKEIEALPLNQNVKVNIHRHSEILDLVAILGQRRTIDAETLEHEMQQTVWLENQDGAVKQLAERLYQQLGFTKQYEELIDRYRQNELWDDNQRLSLFRYLHINPLHTQTVIERFAESIVEEGSPPRERVHNLLNTAKAVLDLPGSDDALHELVDTTRHNTSSTNRIVAVLSAATKARNAAFSELDEKQIDFLYQEAPKLLERFARSLYIDSSDKPEQRQLNSEIIEIAKHIKLEKLVLAAQSMQLLSDPDWLDTLRTELPATPLAQGFAGVHGPILAHFDTPAGGVVIGGYERNIYEGNFALIIDLGGDDYYRGKSAVTSAEQALAMVVDMAGNDEYNHTEIASQGSGILGVGLVYDVAGNDVYIARRLAQGSAFCGIGILHDKQGNDRFISEDLSQGTAFWGTGILLERGGDDHYQSNLYAQGVGAVKGFGLLFDEQGKDDYLATGRDLSSYGVSGVFKGLSQGVGIGFRGYASGGVGMVLDGAGDDEFRAGNFSQGVGYFYGLGILINKGDNDDVYLASRYGQGASAHSATGVLIDEGGNDRYFGLQWALQGFAWDLGSAWFADKKGDDFYNRIPHPFSLASADHNGFAVLVDYEGRDTYAGHPAEVGNNAYHGGYSFSLFIDAGGADDIYRPQGTNNKLSVNTDYGVFTDLPCSIENILKSNKPPCHDFISRNESN